MESKQKVTDAARLLGEVARTRDVGCFSSKISSKIAETGQVFVGVAGPVLGLFGTVFAVDATATEGALGAGLIAAATAALVVAAGAFAAVVEAETPLLRAGEGAGERAGKAVDADELLGAGETEGVRLTNGTGGLRLLL